MSTDGQDPPRVDEIEQPPPDAAALARRLFDGDTPLPMDPDETPAAHMDPLFDPTVTPMEPLPPPYPPDVPVYPGHPPQMPAGQIDTPKVWPTSPPTIEDAP